MKNLILSLLGIIFFMQTNAASPGILGGLEAINLADSVSHCPQELSIIMKTPGTSILTVLMEDLNLTDSKYNLIYTNGPRSPIIIPRGSHSLKITRSFEPANCPPKARDCGGGGWKYKCELRSHNVDQDGDLECARDIGSYGWSSQCSCSSEKVYDETVGSCF